MFDVKKLKMIMNEKFCFTLLAIGMLFLNSRNSPLYYLNNWVDLNAFMTMGRSWAAGLLPYRDLYEQKGPLLYFFYMLSSLLTDGYFGAFLLEVVALSLSLIMCHKIFRLLKDKKTSVFYTVMLSPILVMAPFYKTGGSAEFLVMPAIFYIIYLIVASNDRSLTLKEYTIAGALTFLLLFVKFTFLGIIIGFILGMLVIQLERGMRPKLLRFMLGLLIPTIVLLAYFASQGALKDLIQVYFIDNMTVYTNGSQQGMITLLFANIVNSALLYFSVLKNTVLFPLLLVTLVALILNKSGQLKTSTIWTLLLAYFGLVVSINFGANLKLSYYAAITFPFIIVFVGLLLPDKVTLEKNQLSLITLLTVIISMPLAGNISASKLFPDNPEVKDFGKVAKPVQEIFGDIIKEGKGESLLNYGSIDKGMYLASGILPQNYFFHKPNISYEAMPAIMDEQNELVSHKSVDYVFYVSRKTEDDQQVPQVIRDNYTLAKKVRQESDGRERDFWLFKKK